MKNNLFSFQRFLLVLRKDIMENGKKNLIFLFSGYGIFAVVLIWNSYLYYDGNPSTAAAHNIQLIAISGVIFCILGFIYASTLMNPMSSKVKRTTFLMNPASSMEKYLSRWIQVVVIYLILYFVLFFLADATRVLYCSIRFPKEDIDFIHLSKLVSPYGIKSPEYFFAEWRYLFLASSIYLFIQSIFILGSTFWEKNTFVKTFAAGIAFLLIYYSICTGVMTLVFGNLKEANIPSGLENISEEVIQNCAIVILCTLSLFDWVLGYFRFKESELIKRW